MGIVANQCLEARRSRWWTVVRLPDVTGVQALNDEARFESEDLRRAVMHLPHDQRVVILLHFHLDMPLNDVATALGISLPAVKSRINRALKRLRPAVSEATVNG
jgi:RNA polymerase sigma-70 factor, ECF subfamily